MVNNTEHLNIGMEDSEVMTVYVKFMYRYIIMRSKYYSRGYA